MAEFKDMLKYYRMQAGLSQAELAKKLGISPSSISMYEVGQREPDFETEEMIADFFNVDLNTLRGFSNEYTNIYKPFKKALPVLGKVACGEPIFTNEEREYVTLEETPDNADFILIAKGDSMVNARINDGDYVFIHQQNEVNNGDIAVVLIDDEATLKRVYFDKSRQTLSLVAENPAYAPLIYSGEELLKIRVLGKAIAFQSLVI